MGFNKGLMIFVLIGTLAFTVLTSFVFEISSVYGLDADPEFNETFNQYEASRNLTSQYDSIIEGGDINPEGSDQAVYKNAIVAGKLTRQSSRLAVDMVENSQTIIGLPPVVVGIIVTLIFTLSVFGFMSMIARRNP